MSDMLLAADKAIKEGRKADAAALIIEAISAAPDHPRQVYLILLHLLLDLQRHTDGLLWAERATERAPKDYDFLNLLGAFQRLSGHHQEAIKTFDRAIRLRPAEIAAYVNKGNNYNDIGSGAAAEAIFVKLVRQHPRNAEFQRALARALTAQNKYEAAEKRLKLAVDIDPANADAWLDMAALATINSEHDKALQTLDRAIERLPDHQTLYRAKSAALRHGGKRESAMQFLSSIGSRFGSIAWVHHELAQAFPTHRATEAASHHARAVELAPGNDDYRLGYAEHLMRNPGKEPGEHIQGAYELLKSTLPQNNRRPLRSRIDAHISLSVADFDRYAELGTFRTIGRGWIQAGLTGSLLGQMARIAGPEDRQELVEQHRLWGDKMVARAKRNPIVRPKADRIRRRIRIGFMSSDLREHVVSYFAWPLFEHLDRDRFELYCYSFYRGEKAGPIQQKLESMATVFRWNPQMSDRDAAQMIADDQLDILFELGGSTYMNKIEVMGWKPAPLCASWLGYPHSAGLSTIDYLIVDPYVAPTDPKLLIEQPLVMPKTWIAMSDKAFPDSYAINPTPPIDRNGFVTFGTANSAYKYNAPMLRAWARVMARTPNSRFVFVRPECGSRAFVDNVSRYFAEEGIARERLDFRPIQGNHMLHYNDMDITLDTFPQTGGTTTCEAAWMGVPTVSLVGPAMFERLSYSILTNAGMGDLCSDNVDGYIDIAARLANDVRRLREWRSTLRSQIRSGPLGQTRQFAQDFYDLVAATVEQRLGVSASTTDH